MTMRCGFCLTFLLFAPSLNAAELARWSAAEPAQSGGMTLVKGPGTDWTMQTVTGIRAAAITPLQDYYRRSAILLRIDKPVAGNVWLHLGYPDRGYGQIS